MITIENTNNVRPMEELGMMQILVWHRCKDKLPEMIPERGNGRPAAKTYLVQTASGTLLTRPWANAWNGKIEYSDDQHYQVNTAFARDDIVAWAELEVPYPEEAESLFSGGY